MIFGVDCAKNRVHIVGESLSFETKMRSGTPRDESLRNMAVSIRSWFNQNDIQRKDTKLYVEAAILAGRMNIQATIGIAETVGMVLSLGYPATLVPVASWKKAVVGKGNATKEDVEAWYRSTGGSLQGQDFYDAAAIYAYGVQDMATADKLRNGLLSSAGGEEVPQRRQPLARMARKG